MAQRAGGRADERDGDAAADQPEQDFAARTGYQPSTNQAREEPVPASHGEDRDQEAVLRNEELGSGQPPARPDEAD